MTRNYLDAVAQLCCNRVKFGQMVSNLTVIGIRGERR